MGVGSCSTCRFFRQLLGQPDVAHHARQPRDEARRLDSPDSFDGGVRAGRRHGRP
jgi:hypothetical protein